MRRVLGLSLTLCALIGLIACDSVWPLNNPCDPQCPNGTRCSAGRCYPPDAAVGDGPIAPRPDARPDAPITPSADAKPPDMRRQVDTRPLLADAAPVDTRPLLADAAPVDMRRADAKPVDMRRADAAPVDMRRADAKPKPDSRAVDSGVCKAARDCDDKLTCTVDTCGDAGCRNTLAATSCLIGGRCYADRATNPANTCQRCAASTGARAWTTTTCTAPTTCQTSTCNGAGGCTVALKAGFCVIGGKCVANNAANPANACQRCVTTRSTTAWTSNTCTAPTTCETSTCDGKGGCTVKQKAGFCKIAGVCYANFVANTANKCQRCVSATLPTTWTTNTCTPLTCRSSTCDGKGSCTLGAVTTGFCAINNVCYANGKNHPSGDKCQRCATATTQSAWTVTKCTAPSTCETSTCNGAGGCTVALKASFCKIGTACYASGATNPANVCQVCTPATSTKAWTKVSPCVTTLAGSGKKGLVNGTGAAASFYNPSGIALNAAGTLLYVADFINNSVRTVTTAGVVSTLAGASKVFSGPLDVAVDASNNVYVADYYKARIALVKAGAATTYSGISAGFLDGAITKALFNGPRGLLLNGSTLYVSDQLNYRLRGITRGTVFTAAGVGTLGYLDGTATKAKFNLLDGLAAISSGATIAIADSSNHRIRALTSGKVSTIAGAGSAGFADGVGTAAKFHTPGGIAAISTGTTIYVADTGNHCVRKITKTTVSTYAGVCQRSGHKDGAVATALFFRPLDVAVDSAGNVYVSDESNHRIRVIKP